MYLLGMLKPCTFNIFISIWILALRTVPKYVPKWICSISSIITERI